MADWNRVFEIGLPTRIRFGPGVSRELGELARREGYRTVLVCTDRNLVRAGVLDGIEGTLREAGIRFLLYDEVNENPDLATVAAARERAGGEKLDAVIGVGGGGPIDVAKAASVALTHGGDLRDYVAYTTGQRRPIEGKDLLPVLAVPTTAGSGAEISPVAVIVDETIRVKIGFFSPQLFPRLAVVDPRLAVSLPPPATAGSGLDVLAHAFDGFVSPQANPWSDALAKEALELVFRWLRPVVQQGDDLEARTYMAWASLLGLAAIYLGRGGAAHTIGEPLGTLYGLPHGYACGWAVPAMMEFLLPVCGEKLARIHELSGGRVSGRRSSGRRSSGQGTGEAARGCIAEVKTLIAETGLPPLAERVPQPDLEALAEASMAHLAVDRIPARISRRDYRRLYEKMFARDYLENP